MEKNILSQDPFIGRSSLSEQKKPEELTDVVVVGLSLGALIRRIGFWKACRSNIARFRHILKLWLLREIYLWKALNAKFEQIPENTKEKRLLSLVRKFPILSRVVAALEKSLNKRLIVNPYQPSLMISDDVKIRRKRKKKFKADDLRRMSEIQQNAEAFNRLNKSLWQQEKDNLSTVSR